MSSRCLLVLTLLAVQMPRVGAQNPVIDHVIIISVDGLRPDAMTNLGPSLLPNFYRFRNEGTGTDNARPDAGFTITLPNHVNMVTGHPVLGPSGHQWTTNADPAPGVTIHSNAGTYIPSIFDVAHDNGLLTAFYASKSKFSLFDTSYDGTNGAPDMTGADNGRDKIDLFVFDADIQNLTSQFAADMAGNLFNLTFIHFADTDLFGHLFQFDPTPGTFYSSKVLLVDALLGQILSVVENDPNLQGSTAIILTTDHGGVGSNHVAATVPQNFTIPFYVWGPGVAANTGLYAINAATRADPLGSAPDYTGTQPIRNADAPNLALMMLGLPPVPGSTINPSGTEVLPFGPGNLSPTASVAGTATNGFAPFATVFDGTASTDPDGSIVDWTWFVSDGTLLSGPTVTHTFSQPGAYSVVLQVTDDQGATDLTGIGIQVQAAPNLPPDLTVNPPAGSIGSTEPLVVTLDDPEGLGDLTVFSMSVAFNGNGVFLPFFVPEFYSSFQFGLDAQGRFQITWPDLGFWVNTAPFTSWTFDALLFDTAGNSTQVQTTYQPLP